MSEKDIRTAFGETPEEFRNCVLMTLAGLEEITVTKHIRRTVIFALAALITIIGVAFAAGSSYLFEKLGKSPLDGADEYIIDVAGEPVILNDDIIATVNKVYFVDNEIMYEICLALTDPAEYALIDETGMTEDYAPPADITHIYVEPRLWSRFEFGPEFCDGDPYADGNIGWDENHVLEDLGDGKYILYGDVAMYLNDDVSLLDELDVDVDLNLYYAPQNHEFYVDQEPVEAEIPFHISRSAHARVYNLVPAGQPEGWNITEATLTLSDVSSKIHISYDFGGPLVPADEVIYDFAEPGAAEQALLIEEHTYNFYLHDPANSGSYIHPKECSSGCSGFELFGFDLEIAAMENIPESLTFDVTYSDAQDDGSYIETAVTTIEFAVTPAE